MANEQFNRIDRAECDDMYAEVYEGGGGNTFIRIGELKSDDYEACLSVREARAFRDWLNRALPVSETSNEAKSHT
jgi:hypothetical protein